MPILSSMAATDLTSTDPVPVPDGPHEWHRLLGADELAGRVTTVEVGRRTLCVSSVDGSFGVLDNRCPQPGGPLGEGSIEKGWLRCPWHGYDYSPCNGRPPVGFDDAPDAYAVEIRDGDVWAAVRPEPPRVRTVSDVLVETMTNRGVEAVFGMVGRSNLGFADAMRVAEEAGQLRYWIRHEGAAAFAASAYGKLTGRLAAYFGIAGPGSTNLPTGQQRAAQLDVWQTPLQNPDFAALRRRPASPKVSVAELCGARRLSVRESGELDDALADALAADGPALVHVRTDVRLV